MGAWDDRHRAEMRAIALAVRDCSLLEAAATPYRLAKSIELLCELVTAIKQGSPAQLAGLVVGDLITKVNDTDVATAGDAIKAIKSGSLKDGISLMVVNKEGMKSVFVQVEE